MRNSEIIRVGQDHKSHQSSFFVPSSSLGSADKGKSLHVQGSAMRSWIASVEVKREEACCQFLDGRSHIFGAGRNCQKV